MTSLSFAQDKDILYSRHTYNFKAIPIDSALNFIEKDIDYFFIYNADLIDNKPGIQAVFNNCPLSIILDSLFNNPVLDYSVIQKQIVIFEDKSIDEILSEEKLNFESKTISGIIIDSLTKQALPYSSISILNKGSGTISNLEGKFSFIIRENHFPDTLIISHLGFEPFYIKISDIKDYKTFKLKEKAISLQEILIRWTDPNELLRKALKAVKQNYSSNPTQLRTFYRESLQKDNKYMLYVESLLDVYKGGYRPTLFQDQAKLLQLRKFTNIESNDSILIKLQGGIDAGLTLDLLRNPLDFMTLGGMDHYDYYYSGIESTNGINAHTINFEPNFNAENKFYKGSIHINPISLAIVRIQFKLVKQSAKRLAKQYIISSNPGIKVIPKNIEYTITYKKINNKYSINHIAGEMLLKVKRKRKLLSSIYKMNFEMITTDVKTTNIKRLSRHEKIRSHQILTDLEFSYLENLNRYWGINNFILPESDLLKAMDKFKIEELTYDGPEKH